jgi:predicted small secreted protein
MTRRKRCAVLPTLAGALVAAVFLAGCSETVSGVGVVEPGVPTGRQVTSAAYLILRLAR